MLGRYTVVVKILAGFGLVLCLLAGISAGNLIGARQIRHQVTEAKEKNYLQTTQAIALAHTAAKSMTDLQFATSSASPDPLDAARRSRDDFERQWKALTASGLPPDTQAQAQQLQATFGETFAAGEKMARFAIDQQLLELVEAQNQFNTLAGQLKIQAQNLESGVTANFHATLEEINALSGNIVTAGTIIAVCGVLIGLFLALAIARDICVPLQKVLVMIRQLGSGNLVDRLQFERRDEIGQIAAAMDEMAESLHAMVQNLGRTAAEMNTISTAVANASQQVSAGARKQVEGVDATSSAICEINASAHEIGRGVEILSSTATESTASVLEMAASIEESAQHTDAVSQSVEKVSTSIAQMAASVQQVATNSGGLKENADSTAASIAQMDHSIRAIEQNARQTAEITDSVRQEAENGKLSVDATIVAIQEISSSAQIVSTVITALSERAVSIGSILSVIDSVTDQTNLLALNAAIIAAQAGEQGKGFAVVAGEIRELAERTSQSTKEIASLIAGVQEEAQKAVNAIGRAGEIVRDGERLSLQSGEKLEQIVGGARRAAEQMERVSRSTAEQAEESQNIRAAMARTAQMIDQIATATREQSSGTMLIAEAAEKMREMTLQVKGSISEQNTSGKVIAKSMEEIRGMIRKIESACGEQVRGVGQIVEATAGIEESSAANVESTGILDAAVLSLGRQVELMRKEISFFRTR